MKTLLACLGLALLPALAADDDPVARADGRSFDREAFGRWLVDRVGVSFVEQYVAERLVLEEAEARGLSPTSEAIDRHYEREHAVVVERTYGGEEERWLDDLAAKGQSPEGFARRRKAEMAIELAQEALVRAEREPDEEQLRRRYHDLYGDEGERLVLQALFFSAYSGVDPDAGRPDLAALKAEASRRAAEARERWLAGETLETLLPASDTATRTEAPGGRVAHYRRHTLGKAVESAVDGLDRPGDVTLPVDVFDGTWVLRLEERTPVPLEDVREELQAALREELVTSGEVSLLRSALAERAAVEILLR